uniref:MATH domain-containing protein n=1 Tax=Aegilops tauschii subsp. strangulata TaxID=200361 RepID=A0A453BLI6_AEGTS
LAISTPPATHSRGGPHIAAGHPLVPSPVAMTISTPPPAPAEPQQEEEEVLVPHQELPNGTQPMEVVPAEPAATVENQPTEDTPISRFTWTIDNLSRVNTKKLYSETFVVGGYKW